MCLFSRCFKTFRGGFWWIIVRRVVEKGYFEIPLNKVSDNFQTQGQYLNGTR